MTHCLSAVEPTVYTPHMCGGPKLLWNQGAINYMEDKRYFKLKLEPFAIVDIDIVFSAKKSKQISLLKQWCQLTIRQQTAQALDSLVQRQSFSNRISPMLGSYMNDSCYGYEEDLNSDLCGSFEFTLWMN